MTPQDEAFLRQKFHLTPMKDYIDAKLEQELTTSMRVDLFYQTAECNILPMKLPKIAPRSRYNDEDMQARTSVHK